MLQLDALETSSTSHKDHFIVAMASRLVLKGVVDKVSADLKLQALVNDGLKNTT